MEEEKKTSIQLTESNGGTHFAQWPFIIWQNVLFWFSICIDIDYYLSAHSKHLLDFVRKINRSNVNAH